MAIKRIYSAGGIVLRESTSHSTGSASSLQASSGQEGTRGVEVLVTQHSKHKGWDFPKGHIEEGESSEQAALREVEEETGVVAEIIEKAGQTQYFYWEAGEKVFKTVIYYLMRHVSAGEATTAFEVSGKVWLPPEEVENKLTFEDTKRLWLEVKPKVEQLRS